jgi:hypothetical protein
MSKYFTIKESIDIVKNQIAYHELDRDEPKPELIKALKETLDEFEIKLSLHQKIEMVRDEALKLVNDIESELEKCNMDDTSRLFRFKNIIIARNLLSVMTEDEYIGLDDLDLPLIKVG